MQIRGDLSYAQAQGPRAAQEDYVVHVPFINIRNERCHLLGVLDGHGGEAVAKYCAEAIPLFFDHHAKDMREELRDLTARLNTRTRDEESGSTLSLAYINESLRTVTTAVIGDSPIIVVDDEGVIHRSEEHNVRTNLLERGAAIMRGAIYNSEDGYIQIAEDGDGIQMSRSLGDRELGAILDRAPTLRTHRLGSNSIVIVASDGLLDAEHGTVQDKMIPDIITKVQNGSNAADILRWREEQELNDNTSLVIWKPQKRWWSRFFK